MSAFRVNSIPPEMTYRLRHLVLWPHIERESDCVVDIDRAEGAFHLGTMDGENVISIASFFPTPTIRLQSKAPYRLRAMATHPDYRGKDAGRLLVSHGIEVLKGLQADILWCDARLAAVPFYQKLGFSMIDEIYEVPKIGPHKFMWIDLKG